MKYTIYKIVNNINGKIYIGKHQTKKLDDKYFGSGKYLKFAIEKYGLENFTKEILFVFSSSDEMNAKEAELVTDEFCARDDTYNLCPGGYGGFGYINKNGLSGQSKAAAMGSQRLAELRKNDPDFTKKYSISQQKSWTEERRHQAAVYLKMNPRKNGFGKNNKHTQITKEKISCANKGKRTGGDNPKAKTIKCENEIFLSISMAAKALNVSYNTILKRLNKGLYSYIG